MTGNVGEFEALCRKVTHRFLRSAILIDDEIVTPRNTTSSQTW